MFDTVIFD